MELTQPLGAEVSGDSMVSTQHRLPRAELIRELTIYISCLGWVARPSGGNAEFCREIQGRLTRVLDQIIDPLPQAGDPQAGGSDGMMATIPEMGFRGVGLEFLDPSSNLYHLFDGDTGMYWDTGLDLFSQPRL